MAKTKYNTIDEYIETFPQDVQKVLNSVRQTIHEAAPEATEGFSYGVPAFKINGKNLVLFAAFNNHIGIYPEPETIQHFKKDLYFYKCSKGAIRFPLSQPMPYSLIQKIIQFRSDKLISSN